MGLRLPGSIITTGNGPNERTAQCILTTRQETRGMWIMREKIFTSLEVLNKAIWELLVIHNDSPLKGRPYRETARIGKQDLLILDDSECNSWTPPVAQPLWRSWKTGMAKHSTIITSQLPVRQWHDVIGEKTIADAVQDRIVHNAHRIELAVKSLRKQQLSWN